MAVLAAVKRKLPTPSALTNNPVLIEISDDESDEVIAVPPAKRHKSTTPSINGQLARSQSREGSHEHKVATPKSSRVVDVSESKVKKSPWKQLSRFSYPYESLDRPFAPSFHLKQSQPSQSNGIRSHHREKSSDRPRSQGRVGANPSRSRSPRTSNNIPTSEVQVARASADSQPSKFSRALAESSPRSRLLSVDIRTRPTPTPQKNGSYSANARKSLVPETQSPKLFSPTPSQSNIEIRIPSLLHQWTAPLPKSAAALKAEAQAQKKALLADLMVTAEHAKHRPDELLRHFGQTGFSDSFSTEEDLTARHRLASKKKKTLQPNSRTDRVLDISLDLVDSFDKLIISSTSRITPEQSSRVLLTNRFNEPVEGPPLTFANDVNESLLNGKFQFTDRYIIRSGIKSAPSSTNYGCTCFVSCNLQSCHCFSKEAADETGKGRHTEQRQTYVRRPDGIVVLTDTYMAQELDPVAKHYEITECNEFCACGPDCWNRVVGKGRTVPLEVFQTAKCGFGVRSSVDIVKGQFIELYLGEVITESELKRREDAAEEGESSYIYSLDWFTGVEKYHVDGQYHGTAMRFVNHSCQPNARCFTVQTHKQDKKLYYLAFFAIENIPKAVEIRIDYHGGGSDEQDLPDQIDGEKFDELVRCYCGEKKCRKFLWTPAITRRRRRRRRRRGE
ncbi:uncharacterized protein A1O9_07138 [Exophiala aquamarina CBS 119918]|uniref:Histone-lysine N-methyltransferase SUV39H n=1 Tax=Exophiala aquamarina CBS 119918 TaxID=1182545 RepID=A0A072PCD0_9EURO|nr:uncharacterized protein A1O9_07138 [Exophiala aquamarina CBS 119918]KEF56948.1 hypothetical protein A1O9_07138 [Exophiala aquamarina CBS 119918]